MNKQRLTPLLSLFALLISGTAGFATPNNKKKRKTPTRSTNRGFGTAPPSLATAAAKLPTRLPNDATHLPCPCGSGLTYGKCCEPYHSGDEPCDTPASVLRSRYSAFVYRLPHHVIRTTHPACRDYRSNKIEWLKDLDRGGMFDSYEFVELVAGEEEFSEDCPDGEAFVEFNVRMRARNFDASDGGGGETVVSERSRFLFGVIKETESLVDSLPRWTYAGGVVRSDVQGLEDSVLNQ